MKLSFEGESLRDIIKAIESFLNDADYQEAPPSRSGLMVLSLRA